MPWKQRPAGGYSWLCPLCRTQTIIGTVPVNVCCWQTYLEESVNDHVINLMSNLMTALPSELWPRMPPLPSDHWERIRRRLVQQTMQMVSVHPLFKDKLIVDVNPERHRPYHESLAQAIEVYGETNTAPIVRREFHRDEGSGRSTPTTGSPAGPSVPHDDPASHEENRVREQAATDEKNRSPENAQTVTGRTPSPLPLQNFTPDTELGQEILQRFLREPDPS